MSRRSYYLPINYFKLTAALGVAITVNMKHNGKNVVKPVIYYSFDRVNWELFDCGDKRPGITLQPAETAYFYGDNPNGISSGTQNYSTFTIQGGNVSAGGNIDTLIAKNFNDYIDVIPPYCFYSLFSNCQTLISCPDMPARILSEGCYSTMYKGCRLLTVGPVIKARETATSCFTEMLRECQSLTSVTVYAKEFVEKCSKKWLEKDDKVAGTIYCHPELILATNSTSGVPRNWTRVDI